MRLSILAPALAFTAFALTAVPAQAQNAPCGGSFTAFLDGLRAEAVSRGHTRSSVDAFFRTARQDPAVIAADRRQGIFQRPFIDFSRALISQSRLCRRACR